VKEVPTENFQAKPLMMNKAYEGNACWVKAKKCGMRSVVPPKSNHQKP